MDRRAWRRIVFAVAQVLRYWFAQIKELDSHATHFSREAAKTRRFKVCDAFLRDLRGFA